MYSKELAELGFVIFRRRNETGGIKPHFFVRFKSKDGRPLTFAVDTTRVSSSKTPPDAYFITHAHSDHYGKSAMLSESAWCSEETARALEIRYSKNYKGNTFQTGDTFSVCGVDVQTFDVCHTPGSSAFYWENELGNSILVTGDVKDARYLPKCDILLTEASYGDPADPSCYFKDDIDGLCHAVMSHIGKQRIAFGAYEFGKSQKAVSLLREMGYNGPIAMNGKTLSLTANFVPNAGELIELGKSGEIEESGEPGGGFYAEHFRSVSYSQTQIIAENGGKPVEALTHSFSSVDMSMSKSVSQSASKHAPKKGHCGICIVPVNELSAFGSDTRKYVLTCRPDYPFEIIRLSDHLDVNGLLQMVKDISPKVTVVYHPDKSPRTDRFAKHLEKNGFKAFSINQIQNIIGKEE